jgi:hypothetical protein
MLLVSRQAVYVQGVLFVVVAAIAFGAGYFIGRGRAPDAKNAKDGDAVSLTGNVIFSPAAGIVESDAEAVVMALPRDTPPARKFAARGLRPLDRDAGFWDVATRNIHENGGDCVRADENGAFHLVAPKPGTYYVLLVSRKASRPPGQPIDKEVLAQLSAYFEVPTDLIGQSEYYWSGMLLSGSPAPLVHTFGKGR